jgi:hypothetical protein
MIAVRARLLKADHEEFRSRPLDTGRSIGFIPSGVGADCFSLGLHPHGMVGNIAPP